MIHIQDLRMKFSVGFWGTSVHALRGISLTVERGEIFGFLGPNGAGKTTTIKILLHLLKPSGGMAMINGVPVADPAARRSIGYLPDQPYFYDYLTGPEFLNYCAELSGVPRSERKVRTMAALREVGLHLEPGLQLRKYSRGMLQRIGMAQAILHDPELLILDEPMTGLDPIGRREFKDLILRLKHRGKTVFFSSHILQDAEVLCDRVGILVGGQLVSTGPLDDFAFRSVQFTDITAHYPSDVQAQDAWRRHPSAEIQGPEVHVRIIDPNAVQESLAHMTTTGGVIRSVIPHRSSLEDIFLEQIQNDPKKQTVNHGTHRKTTEPRNTQNNH